MTYTIIEDKVSELFRKEYTSGYPTERRMNNAIKRRMKEYNELVSKPLVDNIVIKIEWVKSRTWGSNPHAEVWVDYVDHTTDYIEDVSVSGCGYCKTTAILERVLNEYARQNLLHDLSEDSTGKEEGVHIYGDHTSIPWYSLSNYVGKFFNFESIHYAWGKSFDEIHIKFN